MGQEVTVSSKSATGGRGLSMSAKKQTPETVRTKNNNVGGFEVPPLGNLVRRRLQTANCTDTSVGMQYIVWPSNPFAFAGNGSNGTLAGDSSGVVCIQGSDQSWIGAVRAVGRGEPLVRRTARANHM